MEFSTNTLICSSSIYMTYPIVKAVLATTHPTFNTSRRKNYIVKNVLKSAVLPALLVYATKEVLLTDQWNNEVVRKIASAYVANDLVGLLMCKLPKTTQIHHIVSCLFLLYAHTIDFGEHRDAALLFYYTLFSAISFPVNAYLGLRLCSTNLDTLHTISKYTYTISLIVNWVIQASIGGGSWMYIVLLLCIIYDDVVLVKWLWRL